MTPKPQANKTIDEKIDTIIEYWDFSPHQDEDSRIERVHNEIKALITEARANERQAMLDVLNGLYEPSIPDLELNEHQGKDEPVIYKSQMEAEIKLRGGDK